MEIMNTKFCGLPYYIRFIKEGEEGDIGYNLYTIRDKMHGNIHIEL